MRICMIVRNPCVRDPRVLKEAASLARAGHNVVIIATAERGAAAREERDGFEIRRVEPVPSWVRRVTRRSPVPTHAADEASKAGNAQPAQPAPSAAGARAAERRPFALVTARDIMVTRQLTAAALATPADAYHAHDLNTLQAGVRASRRHHAPLVYDAHELYPELTGLGSTERARWARIERRLIRLPDVVVTPSESRADEMARRYGIARPTVVMNCPPAGPRPDPAASPLARLRRPGEILLVYAGGYSTNRGLENLVRAPALLDHARLLMLGWGRLEGELREAARQSGAEDRVEFLTPIEHDRVVEVVAGADIGMAPYLPIGLNNVLAAPNKLFEYLHAGLAVAGSDLPDIRRVVEQDRVGALFDASDAASIAAAVREIARGDLPGMRERALAAAPRYTWEAQEHVLAGIYENFARA